MLKKMFLIAMAGIIVSCGTLGGIGKTICFPTSKKKLEMALDSLYSKHPEYAIPNKWKSNNDWSSRGYDFLESRIFYFKSPPEEMYYVSFIGDSAMFADTTLIRIAIRSIYNESLKKNWLEGNGLDVIQKKRIYDRFQKQIVTKLEKYTKTRAFED